MIDQPVVKPSVKDFYLYAKIFERFRAIYIEPIGLRSLLRPSFKRLGVRRSIVSKSDMIPFNDRGISL